MTTKTVILPVTQFPKSITGSYTLDTAHTQIGFSARHAMVTKVHGAFNEFDGSGFLDAEHPANSHLSVTIKTSSIDTRNEMRDNHLKSNDFFDMEKYPEIKFVSSGIERLSSDLYRVVGDLTIKDVTKSISIDFTHVGSETDAYGNQRVGFEGSTTINRKDYGVNWNANLDSGGVMVSDKVTLEFEVSAIRTKNVD